LPNNEGGGIILRAGQHGVDGGSDGSVTLMDGQGNDVIKGTSGDVDGGGALTSQSWRLGTTSYGTFKLARDAAIAVSGRTEAGTTYFKGQTPGTDQLGGDLHIRGGATGAAAAAGGDIFIDAGRSKIQGGAAALYGALLIGTISGTVNVGQPTSTTTISGTAQVLENLVVASLDSESESLGFCDSSACNLMKGEYDGHSSSTGTPITFRGQQGAAGNYAGGDLILRAGEDRNTQTPGLVTISTASTSTVASSEVIQVGPLYPCPDYGSNACRMFSTWSDAADAVYVKSAQHTLYTNSIDAGSAGIYTTVAQANTYNAATAVQAATVTIAGGSQTLTTPKLSSSGDEIQIRGSSDAAAATITRGAYSASSDFTIVGQSSTTELGGNMVLQAGDSTTTQGRVVFASGDSSACNREADGEYASCSLAYVDSIGGVFHQQVLTPAGIEVNGEVQGGRITTTVATASSQVSAVSIVATGALSANTVTDSAVQFGDNTAFTLERADASVGSGTSLSVRGQSASTGVGGDVIALPGVRAGAGAAGVVSIAASQSGQPTVTVGSSSVHFSQAIQSTQAIDAADGTVSTTGSFAVNGGNVAIASASVSQRMHAESFVQLRELLGETDSTPAPAPSVSLGSAGIGLAMQRAQHGSWDGTATTLRGQKGGSSSSGGNVVLRAGAGGGGSVANSGSIVLKDSAGSVGVTMSPSPREITIEKTLATQQITANSGTVTADTILAHTLSSTAGDAAATMAAQTLDMSTAATVSALRSASDALEVGAGDPFVLSRPDVPPNCFNNGVAVPGYLTEADCERTDYSWDEATSRCTDGVGVEHSEHTTRAMCLGEGDQAHTWTPASTARLKLMGQAGINGAGGGDMIVRPGDGLSGGNVRVADADSNTVILVASDSISTAAVMNTEGIDAGTNAIEATQLTGGTVTATLGVTAQTVVADQAATPQLLSGTGLLGLGDTAAFVAKRTSHSSGAGTAFSIRGQSGAASADAAGGSVRLKAAAGVGSGPSGALELESASGTPVVTVGSASSLTISQVLRTQAVQATQISTSGTVNAATISAPSFVVSSSLKAPALTASDASAQSQTVLLGSAHDFDVKRPDGPGHRCQTSSGTVVPSTTNLNACERTGFEWVNQFDPSTASICSIPILAATVTTATEPPQVVAADAPEGNCCQASRAIDGIVESQSGFVVSDATYWQSGGTDSPDLNFDMQLRTPQMVKGVVIHWQRAITTEVRVWTSPDGVAYTSRAATSADACASGGVCDFGEQESVVTFSSPTSAQYVRIGMTGGAQVGIYAIHVQSSGSTVSTCETTGNSWVLPDGSEFYIAGQTGFAGSGGGDVVFVTGTGAANGDVLIQGALNDDAVGDPAVTVVDSGVTVHQLLHPQAGINADRSAITTTSAATAGTVSASVQLTAVEIPATISVATPLLLPPSQTADVEVRVGGTGSVSLTRTAHEISHGTSFVVAGQAAGVGDVNGGDVVLRGGDSSATGGGVKLHGDLCGAVSLDGNSATCTGAGSCTYTAAVTEACDAPVCTLTAGTDCSIAVPGCVYTPPPTPEACAGDTACTDVTLDGNAATCTNAGDCIYTPADTTPEACAPPSCGFTAGDSASCTGTTGCIYTAPVVEDCSATDETSTVVVAVAPAAIAVSLPLTLNAALDAGGETIAVGAALTATGSSTEVDVAATTATSDRLKATLAIVTPVLNPGTAAVTVGGDTTVVIGRPAHASGAGVDFRIEGQSANAGDDVGVDAGNVVLRPGASSGAADAGVIAVQSADGTSTMLEAVSGGLRVPLGSSLRTVDTVKVPGARVAKPPSTTSVSDDSTVITPTTELVLLDCDDNDNARNEVFSPTFAAGVDGQVVRMVNVGEDVCVFKGPASIAAADASDTSFKLLAGNQDENQAFLPTSGTPVSFMYYHTPSDMTCSTFDRAGSTDADRQHSHQTTCAGGGWYQVVEAPATYCADTCAADGLRWCQHEATHAAPSVSGVAAGSINDDARLDIISVTAAGTISWFESAADEGVQWTEHEITAAAVGARHVLVLDVDGDGDQDVATVVDTTSSGDLVWYRNGGSGGSYAFDGPHTIRSDIGTGTDFSLAMVAGNVGTDAKDDIVVVSTEDTAVFIFECTGNDCTASTHWGSSGTPVELSPTTTHIPATDLLDDIVLGDLDADGDLDIVTVSRAGTHHFVRWYQNLGGNSWSKHDDTTDRAPYSITSAPQTLTGTRLRLAVFDMNGDGTAGAATNVGLDVVVSSPGNGRLYVLQNQGSMAWSQINMNSDSPGVTAVVVADVDGDGRQDVIAAGEEDMKYHLTGGGGIHGNANHPGYDGQSWTALTATEFTGTCEYNTQADCTGNGGTWDAATESCDNVPATLACYANSGLRTGGARGWAAPTMIAAANAAGSSGLDIVFASDSSGVEGCTVVAGTAAEETTAATTCTLTAADAAATPAVVGACAVATGSGTCTYVAAAGYVGVYESISGTC
jgi:hypothetical protein